jgi:hypothetical protein
VFLLIICKKILKKFDLRPYIKHGLFNGSIIFDNKKYILYRSIDANELKNFSRIIIVKKDATVEDGERGVGTNVCDL